MPGCAHCNAKLDIVAGNVGRRDTCPHCENELHSCLNCRHFDDTVAKGCKEPFAEVPSDRHGANFCEYYQIGEGGLTTGANKTALESAADALFKKR